MRTVIFVTTALIGLAGCSREAPPARVAAPLERPTAAAPEPTSPTHSVVNITPEIRRACGIPEADAHFAFDSAHVRTSDYPTLDQLVTCFTTGPLADREMRLVGHADPRGEGEYNMALGGSRADNVRRFLVDRGMQGERVATSSRGELDATGTSESSWARDRRVDVRLANQ